MPADYRSLLSTIDKLYAAALEPSEWHRFLALVAALFDADNAFVCQAENRRRPFDYIGLNQRNRDAVPLEALRDGQGPADARVQRELRPAGSLPDGRLGP